MPALAHRLVVGNLRRGKADLGNQAAKIGIGIVDLREDVDEAAVVEPEAGRVLVQLDLGQAR